MSGGRRKKKSWFSCFSTRSVTDPTEDIEVDEIDISQRGRQIRDDAEYARTLSRTERSMYMPPRGASRRTSRQDPFEDGFFSFLRGLGDVTEQQQPARTVTNRQGAATTTTQRRGGTTTTRTESRGADGSTIITRTVTRNQNHGGVGSNQIHIQMGGGRNSGMGGMTGPMVTLHSFSGGQTPQQVPLFDLLGGLRTVQGNAGRGGGLGGLPLLMAMMAAAGGGLRGEGTNDPQHPRWWRHRMQGADRVVRAEINQLPVRQVQTGAKTAHQGKIGKKGEGQGKDENAQCAVCLTDFEGGDEVRTLPCLHVFHKNCIDKWLVRNKTCPICKASIS